MLPALFIVGHLTAAPISAQTVRRMEFVSGARQNELAINVQYQEPSEVHAQLDGSRVVSILFEVRNLSSRPAAFNYRDLRLNIGGNTPLAATDAGAAFRGVLDAKHVPGFLRVLGGQAKAFHPHQLRVWLAEQQLKDGSIAPGQVKKGLVFFLCPAGADPSALNGVIWLESTGRAPQMLETKGYTVWTKAPEQNGFGAMLRKTWNRYFSNDPPAFNRSYALLIGIGKYQHLNPLEAPAQDVRKVAEYLIAQGFDEVVTITDEHVTPEAFRQPQKYFKTKLEPEDRFLFYYSGHGMSVIEDGKTRGYLPLIDEVGGGTRRSIAMDALVAWMNELTTEHLLVILDSCFSGLATGGLEWKDGSLSSPTIDQATLHQMSRGRARYLLMAGTDGQPSVAGRQWNGSLFTEMLLRGLRRDADYYRNHIVTTRALYVWLRKAVSDEALKVNAKLTPQFLDLGPSSVGEFIFVQ
jgi:caspase domain-containing protein